MCQYVVARCGNDENYQKMHDQEMVDVKLYFFK
jgi:hypothetical protein